jgi:hypothetical protein
MRLLLSACLALLAGCAVREDPAPLLGAEGKWSGPIWIPESPEFEELLAARELADWCERVTGHRPEVRAETDAPARAGIALGRTRAAARHGLAPPAGDGDTALRRTVGGLTLLLGNSPAATRMAAGRFAEDALGLTFALPGAAGADWQPRDRILAPPDESWRPAFAWRAVSGLDNPEALAWGRALGYGSRPRCTHGTHLAFNPDLFATRPELFPGPDGSPLPPSRGGRSAQPDFTHPDAPALAAAAARRWLEANPRELAVPLGINDSVLWPPGPAHWPGGRVWDGRPNRSAVVFGFLNRVAAADWNPGGDRALGALAYLDVAPAPPFGVHPDIFPAVCADRIQYSNKNYARLESDNLAAWGRSGVRRLATWDYWFGRDVPFPRLHLPALAASLRAAAAAGVDSWYAETTPLWTFDAPKLWVAAKLLDNSSVDPVALEARWFAAAYGPAAPPMRALFAEIGDCWAAAFAQRLDGEWLRGWRDGALDLPGLDALLDERAPVLLAQAQAALDAAPDDPRHRRMRQRLAQFRFAWDAVLAQRARVREAEAAALGRGDLARMLAAERRRDDALATLNRNPWPGSNPVAWQDFPEPNPWPLLVKPGATLPADAPLAARLAVLATGLPRPRPDSPDIRWSPSAEPTSQGWTLWLADASRPRLANRGLEVIGPQGRLHRRLPVQPGTLLEVRVRLSGATAAQPGNALLTVRFPSPPSSASPPRPKPLHPDPKPTARQALPFTIRLLQGDNALLVPVTAAAGPEAEVEISFVDRLPALDEVIVRRRPSR